MMRQIRMQPRPAAVAATVQSRYWIVVVVWILAVHAQITLAAKFDRRVTHFDAHALAAAGAQPPEFGRRERCRADRGLSCRPDRKSRRPHRPPAAEADNQPPTTLSRPPPP